MKLLFSNRFYFGVFIYTHFFVAAKVVASFNNFL